MSTQEEALLAAQEEERYEESPYGGSANYLTYADLGYVPENPRNQPTFIAGSSYAFDDRINPYDDDECSGPALKSCQRGGRVTFRGQDAEDYSGEWGLEFNNEQRVKEVYPFVRPGKSFSTFITKLKPSKGYLKYTRT
jgi:hypothetical protein